MVQPVCILVCSNWSKNVYLKVYSVTQIMIVTLPQLRSMCTSVTYSSLSHYSTPVDLALSTICNSLAQVEQRKNSPWTSKYLIYRLSHLICLFLHQLSSHWKIRYNNLVFHKILFNLLTLYPPPSSVYFTMIVAGVVFKLTNICLHTYILVVV